MIETSSLHLVTKDELKNQNIKPNGSIVEVEDSKTDYKFLRPDLLICALRTLADNVDSEYPQKIFEVGSCFGKDSGEETGIKENCKLVISLAPGNFTELKQIIEYLGRMLDVEFKVEEVSDARFIEGRTGKILLGKDQIGVLGS